jgi:hypothetical protein
MAHTIIIQNFFWEKNIDILSIHDVIFYMYMLTTIIIFFIIILYVCDRLFDKMDIFCTQMERLIFGPNKTTLKAKSS